jgi:hypothetical protein
MPAMTNSRLIPAADADLLVWLDHFIDNLSPDHGISDSDLAILKAANADFHAKTIAANQAAALARQATAEKNTSRQQIETLVRAEIRRIKASNNYTAGSGKQLGIETSGNRFDSNNARPQLAGADQTGGKVALSFAKYRSDGINLYCQRENDSDWQLLSRATVSPFIDNRPLMTIGKPELRRYCAVYVLKDQEVGEFSHDVVVTCAP